MSETHPARRVLLIDDDRDLAEILGEAIRSFGHDVRVAFDGLSCLELVGSHEADVVFLDVGLPHISGFEACRLLRERGCESRIIALTGYTDEQTLARIIDAGFDERVLKPPMLDTLEHLIVSAPRLA